MQNWCNWYCNAALIKLSFQYDCDHFWEVPRDFRMTFAMPDFTGLSNTTMKTYKEQVYNSGRFIFCIFGYVTCFLVVGISFELILVRHQARRSTGRNSQWYPHGPMQDGTIRSSVDPNVPIWRCVPIPWENITQVLHPEVCPFNTPQDRPDPPWPAQIAHVLLVRCCIYCHTLFVVRCFIRSYVAWDGHTCVWSYVSLVCQTWRWSFISLVDHLCCLLSFYQ